MTYKWMTYLSFRDLILIFFYIYFGGSSLLSPRKRADHGISHLPVSLKYISRKIGPSFLISVPMVYQ